MLQNKLNFPHLIIFFVKVYLDWGEGSIQRVGRETLQLTCTAPPREQGWRAWSSAHIANQLKGPGLKEMTEGRKQLDSLFSRGP